MGDSAIEFEARRTAAAVDGLIDKWVTRREAFEIIHDDEKAALVSAAIGELNVMMDGLRHILRAPK